METRVKAFFYLLLRDALPFGVIEKIISDLDEQHMAMYAEALTRRLTSTEPKAWKRDDIGTLGVLSLTVGGAHVPLSAIREWTDAQCQSAEAWASEANQLLELPIPPHIAARASWVCGRCQQRNSYWAAQCGRCERAREDNGTGCEP